MTEIVDQSNAILKQKAQDVPVGDIGTPHLANIIDRMKNVLSKEPLGVAIAAPQIGESLRIFVVSGKVFDKDKEKASKTPDRTYINPEVLKTSRKKNVVQEGCLSVRSYTDGMLVWGDVRRADKMKIRAYDEKGKRSEHSATGFLSQVFQHEIDHLDGILYTSKAERIYEEKLPKPE